MAHRTDEKGSALVGAVVMMVVVGILILMITTNMLTALQVTDNAKAVSKARSNSDAGFDRAYLAINSKAGGTDCNYPAIEEFTAGTSDQVSFYYNSSPLQWLTDTGGTTTCTAASYVSLSIAGFGGVDATAGKFDATYTQQVTFKLARTTPGTAGYIDSVVVRLQKP